MDPQLGADQHEDATETRGSTKRAETYASEEVHRADEEGDEQVGAVEAEEPGEESDGGCPHGSYCHGERKGDSP